MELLERQDLKDIKNVSIDLETSTEERIRSFIAQIGNPYCYKYNNTVVQIRFSGEEKLEDKLLNHIINK
ncbi:MAG: DUF6870 family protein [Eubacteriales bacterium]